MAAELDAVQRATIAIHIEQLQQKRQKLSQLDTEIADFIEKPEHLEEEILESEELQCTITEQICRAKTFLELDFTNTTVGRTYEKKHTAPTGIIATQPSQSATQQTVQPSSAIVATQPPQSSELGSNSPSQGAALSSSMMRTSSNSNSSTVQNVSRLPKLILSTFDGNPLYWQFSSGHFICLHKL